MSAGVFVRTFYQASYGDEDEVHPIRVQPETIEAAIDSTTNVSAATEITNPISALVSRSRSAKGLIARIIYIELRTGESPPEGYSERSRTKIPCMTEAFYNAAIAPGDPVVEYLGSNWRVVGSSEERAR